MNKEQAKIEFCKIIDDLNRKCDEITNEAKKNGTLRMGLDSNNALYKDVKDEAKRKIKVLLAQIAE